MRRLAVVSDTTPVRHLPTASALQRAFLCPASEALPHSKSTSEYAERGTVVHAFLENAHKIGRDRALEIVTDDDVRQMCAALPLDELPSGGDREIAIAWDYDTDIARILPSDGARDYSAASAREFVGTADYVGRDPEGVVVVDFKTGHRFLGPAKSSRQLRFLALAGARLTGIDAARVAYFFLRDDGTYGASWATFDVLDLAEIGAEMAGLAERLRNARPDDVHEGSHCDFCPAFNSCPAKMTHALAIGTGTANAELASIEARLEELSDERLGEAYARLEAFYAVADRVKETIRKRAAMREVPLSDGRVLGTVQWPYTVANARVAHEVITERHGAQVADEVVPRSTTLTAVKKLGKATLEAIEQRGGIVTGTKPQVRVHRAKGE
jgi:hypothetical protein